MGLADIVRAGVAIADRVTGGSGGLQVSVTHETWTGQDKNTKPTYAAAVTRSGLLSYETKAVRGLDGHERVSTAQFAILSNVAVDPRDRFTLPDGTTPKVVHIASPADAGIAGGRFVTEVWFGEGM